MVSRNLIESLNFAIEGLIYVIKTQRNMRLHLIIAVLIISLSIFLNVSKTELIFLTTSIVLVLLTEMINTSIELSIDMVKKTFHPLARIIKDISAGAVLVSSINAIIVGYIIFINRVEPKIELGVTRLRQSSWHMSFLCLVVLLCLVIIGKAIFHKGTPLRGGMPSGHSAVAFSIWTIIAFLTSNIIVISLVFILAFLIAQSRVKKAVHTIWEVATGGLLGIFLTTLIFQFLK
ncbi:MAG: phosphatase PAP2 family protein [Candidatus Omnitrophica bacterium]|nr:phosphatase PAP2 family protein [Candidatus Omnitrophota bacterium]